MLGTYIACVNYQEGRAALVQVVLCLHQHIVSLVGFKAIATLIFQPLARWASGSGQSYGVLRLVLAGTEQDVARDWYTVGC